MVYSDFLRYPVSFLFGDGIQNITLHLGVMSFYGFFWLWQFFKLFLFFTNLTVLKNIAQLFWGCILGHLGGAMFIKFLCFPVKLFPPFHTVLFWKEVAMCRPCLRSRGLCFWSDGAEYPHAWLEIFLHRRLVCSPPLIYYLIIRLYQYGLMDIYFIF